MSEIEFSIVSSDFVRKTPRAYEFLLNGSKDFGGMLSVEKALHLSDHGNGYIIFCKKAILLLGCAFVTITQQETGKVLTSVLLGGDNFDDWASELREFYYKLAKDHDCDEFMLMGRRGFKRIFPELEEVATVFRVILKGTSKNIK